LKKRVPIALLVVAVLILSISLQRNFSYSSEKEHLRLNMLSASLFHLNGISRHLDKLLIGIEEATMSYEQCEDELILLSNYFTELHFSLKTYATYFPPPGISRNCYSGHIGFDFIGQTLVGGWGEFNHNRYNGIMFDNTISDKEVQYLTALKESVDNMIEAIATTQDNRYELVEISPSYLDEVILDFTDKYYIAYDDSPLKLLF